MNVQEATNLTITEGEVKAIHDSSNRQLWGRLNYDTTYKGDTTQATYSGKNLIDNANLTYTYATNTDRFTLSTIDTGIKVTATSGASVQPIVLFKSIDLSTHSGKTIRMKGTFNAGEIRIGRMGNTGGNRTGAVIGSTSDTEISFVVPADLGASPYLYYGIRLPDTDSQLISSFTNLILTLDNNDMSYEPYVGAIPAPNPDYPQTVNVVTGTQTITLTDGEVSDDYTVTLGSTELVKVGDYQDYIYKSGEDWYVHKEVGKVVLDGTIGGFNSGNDWYYADVGALDISPATTQTLSNYFTASNESYMIDHKTVDGLCAVNHSKTHFILRNLDCTSANEYRTWLGNTNPIFYYLLATPTDAKITDSTLVGQLNAIHDWLTRYGYTATVAGNLPLIISQTALT